MQYRVWRLGRLLVGLGTTTQRDPDKGTCWEGKPLPVVRDDNYWLQLRQAVGKGTRSRLWGTSSRDLDRAVDRLRDSWDDAAIRKAAVLLATCQRCRNQMAYLGQRDAEQHAYKRLLALHLNHNGHDREGWHPDDATPHPVLAHVRPGDCPVCGVHMPQHAVGCTARPV